MNGWIGRTLGKVQIESLIARGGVAEIYLGTHATLQRKVAVKILRAQYEDDPNLLERFQREAVVVSRLRHPNIVQIYDFDSVEGHPYIVMEHVPGPSLSRYLDAFHDKGKRLDMPTISHFLTAVANALEYAHKMGVIHRDVKPGNILLTSPSAQILAGITLPAGFEPILTDFGLVRFLNSSRHTTAGQIAGTPAYMSPEQSRGEATDERTDIYSLGIVLYEMLSGGHVPFEGETTMSVLLKQIHEPVTPLLGLAPAIQVVLDRVLAKDRNERYQTPTQFAADFQTAIENPTKADTLVHAAPVSVPIPQPKARPRRIWWPAYAAAILVIAIGSYLWFGKSIQEQNRTIIPDTGGIIPSAPSPIQAAPIHWSSTVLLRFKNANATADQAELIAQAMPFPPTGSHYEAWLSNSESHQPLGALFLDEQGKGSLVYTDSGGNNLIGLYDRVEVSIESGSRTGPKSPGQVAFAFRMPADGLVHVRYLLAASPNTPDEAPVMQGLITDIRMIQQNSTGMNTDYKKGDTAAMKQKAQIVLNLIEGDQSPGYKYLDASGELLEPFDGFGLLANGSNTGYIQAAFSEADYAANTPGATLNMINNGEAVKVCTQNLAAWAPQLRENMLAIISSSSGANLVRPIADAVRLADQLLNGIDLDGNQLVDAVPGECGAVLALENSYYMADMPLLPVSPNPTGTATEIPLTASPTNTRVPATIAPTNNPSGSGAQNTSAPPAATKPGNRQNDKPKPTKKNNP